ncbi:MAG TPA: dethiobiotin synthase [Acidimicrobiales bacterium]|nr:dethiobiotin synthase [Acidimicrobiales bacterium]
MTDCFVVGTDTGVGKTVISAGIVACLRGRGFDVGIAKPVQSGAVTHDPDGDAWVLSTLSGVRDPLDSITPFAFPAPLAPLIAARLSGVDVALDDVVLALDHLRARHTALVIEGAGGLHVPVGESWTIADLVCAVRSPVVIVARASLGTVNHTVLTIEALRARGVDVVGVVLNGVRDDSSATNASLIERIGDVRVIGELPLLDRRLTRERVRALAEQNLDVDTIVAKMALGTPSSSEKELSRG